MREKTIWRALEERFKEFVKLAKRPVAVAFLDAAPDGVNKFEGTEPSSCSFWRLAAAGNIFYTVPENHFNCAVGAYTHNIALSPEREKETEQTLKMMFELGYVRAEEVPQIPRLSKSPKAIVYAPLGDSPVTPDVVLFSVKPAAAMLLNEAAGRAGVGSGAVRRIASIAQIMELHSFHDSAVVHIEATDDAFGQHFTSQKLFRMRSPTVHDFSGWNCTPKIFSCSTTAENCAPYSLAAVVAATTGA